MSGLFRTPTIWGMSRIKNEGRWLASVLESQLPLVERMFILDDHSTDDTAEICGRYDKVTLIPSPYVGLREDRDKNYLLEQVEKVAKDGDLVLSLDGDEELAPGSAELIREIAKPRIITAPVGPDCWRFRVLYLWNSPDQYRTDGIYGRFRRASMFRMRHGVRFVSKNAGGFHCGNVPVPTDVAETTINILHYGYMHKEDRIRKWAFYNANDPRNRAEGYRESHPHQKSYGHMVQGDVPEVTANEQLIHAGPLTLRPLSEVVAPVVAQ